METILRIQSWVDGTQDLQDNNQFYWLAKLKKNLVKTGLRDVIYEAERDFFNSTQPPVMTYVQLTSKYGVYTIGSERFFPLTLCLHWSLLVCHKVLFDYYWSQTANYKSTKLGPCHLVSIIQMEGSDSFFAYLFFKYHLWFNTQEKNDLFHSPDKSSFVVHKLLTESSFYYECYADIKIYLIYSIEYKINEFEYFINLRLANHDLMCDLGKTLLSNKQFEILLSNDIFNNLKLKCSCDLLCEQPFIFDQLILQGIIR